LVSNNQKPKVKYHWRIQYKIYIKHIKKSESAPFCFISTFDFAAPNIINW